IVDGNRAAITLVEPVSERRCGRLVDDTQNLEPRDASPVARSRSLSIVEIRGNRDDGPIDLEIELAFITEEPLRTPLQLAEHERRDLWRRELAIHQTDPDDASWLAADAKRQQPRLVAHIVDTTAHEAFYRVNRTTGCRHQPSLRFTADMDRPLRRERYGRG